VASRRHTTESRIQHREPRNFLCPVFMSSCLSSVPSNATPILILGVGRVHRRHSSVPVDWLIVPLFRLNRRTRSRAKFHQPCLSDRRNRDQPPQFGCRLRSGTRKMSRYFSPTGWLLDLTRANCFERWLPNRAECSEMQHSHRNLKCRLGPNWGWLLSQPGGLLPRMYSNFSHWCWPLGRLGDWLLRMCSDLRLDDWLLHLCFDQSLVD
jgi:hypothetical protein